MEELPLNGDLESTRALRSALDSADESLFGRLGLRRSDYVRAIWVQCQPTAYVRTWICPECRRSNRLGIRASAGPDLHAQLDAALYRSLSVTPGNNVAVTAVEESTEAAQWVYWARRELREVQKQALSPARRLAEVKRRVAERAAQFQAKGYVTLGEAATLVGLDEVRVDELRRFGVLEGVKIGRGPREYVYLAGQFDAEQNGWLFSPNHFLAGEAPVSVLRMGLVGDVLDAIGEERAARGN